MPIFVSLLHGLVLLSWLILVNKSSTHEFLVNEGTAHELAREESLLVSSKLVLCRVKISQQQSHHLRLSRDDVVKHARSPLKIGMSVMSLHGPMQDVPVATKCANATKRI